MDNHQKLLDYYSSSEKVIRKWPEEAQSAVYRALGQLQIGTIPNNVKTMTFVGHGAYEIRVMRKYRVIYHVGKDTVTVLTAFYKTTDMTPKHHMKVARKALGVVTKLE